MSSTAGAVTGQIARCVQRPAAARLAPIASRTTTATNLVTVHCRPAASGRRTLSSACLLLRTTQSPRLSTTTPTTRTIPTCRAYHSYDHPPPPGPFSETEQAILSAAYKHVPEYGFSEEALALGARDAGYLDISTNLLPEGAFSLIRWHLVTQREALASRVDSNNNSVEALTWERLLGNKDVIRRWQEALAIMAQPSHVPASLKELAMLADEILYLSGDTSVDPSWYTKRASLSAVYASAELFMTNDFSEGFQDTRAFLKRRLNESAEVRGVLRSVGEWVTFTASAGVNVLRSKGVRI
ncbi:COQ9-domain-containing protein [Diplogelasinospora grovesii]|uniref:Ubiquinone biosynthesis protein n=1 Tax=Diplogelasinospora grovesii TaxID=303347 RepID=A0AAN6S5X1_9PEZI|nr:COQ9-domain-containing protein [Diplogelasinospora grovesii]